MARDLMEFGDLQFEEKGFADARPVELDGTGIPETMPEKWERLLRHNPKARELWDTDHYGDPSRHAYALMGLAGRLGLDKSEAAAVHVAHYARLGRKEDGIRKAPYALRAWEKGRQEAEQWEANAGNGRARDTEEATPLAEPSPVQYSQTVADATLGVDAFLTPPPQAEWDVEGVRVAGDPGWSSGAPKSMKGLTTLEEARACATGTLFLGHFKTRKKRVSYISEEDRQNRLHRRVYAKMHGRPPEEIPGPDDLRFLIKAGVRLDTDQGKAILREHIAAVKPDLVFLDHFDRMHSKDNIKPEQMYPLINFLDALRDEFGCTFRVVKHHRKEAQGQSKRTGEMISGTVALFGWGESSIYFTLIKRGLAKVEVEAKDGDTSDKFLVRFEAGRIVYAGEVGESATEEKLTNVREYVKAHPGCTTQEVAQAQKWSPKTAAKYLKGCQDVTGKQENSKQPMRWSVKSLEIQGEMGGN